MEQHPSDSRLLTITREGWIYLVILAFISLGAVLRNVNLLILMAGMMFAPFIINWRLSVHWLRKLSAKRSLPLQVHAREMVNLQWVCFNHSKVSVWNVEIFDSIHLSDRPIDWSADQGSLTPARSFYYFLKQAFHEGLSLDKTRIAEFNVRVEFPIIAAKQSQVGTGRVFFPNRGVYNLGPSAVVVKSPFGLLRCHLQLNQQQALFVAPELGILTPAWNRRIRSAVIGSETDLKSRGIEEDEFHALRQWQSGDSSKHIHWRTSARLGRLAIRVHEQPDNRDFAMLLDLYCPDSNPLDAATRDQDGIDVEKVLSFAATVLLEMDSSVTGSLAVALCGKNRKLIRSRNRREVILQAMRHFAAADFAADPELVSALMELGDAVSSSTPIFVVSTRPRPTKLGFDHPSSPDTQKSQKASKEKSGEPISKETESDSGIGIDTDSTVSSPQQAALDRVWKSVHWLTVGSSDFNDLYRSKESSLKTAKETAQHWANSNVRH